MSITPKYYNFFFFIIVFLILFSFSCVDKNVEKKQQNITTGMMLYRAHCQNCHGLNGEGLSNAYPPLAGTDYLLKNKNHLPCIIRNGMNGKIVINDKSFNLPMPPISLTEIETAQIVTYITNEWGNNSDIFTRDDVVKSLKNCKDE